MAAYDLSNFHEGLRIALRDEGDPVAGYDYSVDQLNAGLRTTIRMGNVPGVALAAGATPVQLVDEPSHPDVWGLIVLKTALLMISGGILESMSTRAMTSRLDATSRRDAVAALETMIHEIDARGNIEDPDYKGNFATSDDVVTRIRFCCAPCP